MSAVPATINKAKVSISTASAWAAQMSYAHIGTLRLGADMELVGNMRIAGLQASERYATLVRIEIPTPSVPNSFTSVKNLNSSSLNLSG